MSVSSRSKSDCEEEGFRLVLSEKISRER